MIKLKNREVLEIDQALAYLSQQNTSAWYGVSKNIRIITPLLKEIEASKLDIYKKYAKTNEKGNIETDEKGVVFNNKEEADKMWVSLMEEEVEVEFFRIKLEDLKEFKLDASLMSLLVDRIIFE